MALRRAWVAGPLVPGERVTVTGPRAHHLGRVLRMGPGDPCRVFDGTGAELDACIERVDRHGVGLLLGEAVTPLPESPLRVTLALGVSRGERTETAIQKAVELGVSRVAPVLGERSTVRLDGERARQRQRRWEEVARNACEQCGRSRVPPVDPPRPLQAWLQGGPAGLGLCLLPGAERRIGDLDWSGEEVTLLTGPEGGLSEAEARAAAAAGYLGVGLGPRVLRAETAPLAALALLQGRWGDLGG